MFYSHLRCHLWCLFGDVLEPTTKDPREQATLRGDGRHPEVHQRPLHPAAQPGQRLRSLLRNPDSKINYTPKTLAEIKPEDVIGEY